MDRLKELFAELERSGFHIDERRMIASFKFSGRISAGFAKDGEAGEFEEDDNYFYATFRALSMTSFPWKGMMLDFSKNGVLKKATKLLQGQTVYSNHNTEIENWMGVVVQSRWDESAEIPQGINTRLRLSKKWNEKVIDGIREGAIHSASVDVLFDYSKSHPDLADFWFMQGEEVNGEVVRVIATKIISLDELSLVWQGADPYAKKLAAAKYLEGKSIPESGSGPSGDEVNDGQDMPGGQKGGFDFMKLKRSTALAFGLTLSEYGFGSSVQEVELDEGMQARFMADASKSIERLGSESEKKQEILDGLFGKDAAGDLKEHVNKIKAQAAAGEAHLKEVKDEAVKFAKLAEGKEELNSALSKAIENASLEDAIAFRDEYRAKAEEKFPAKCEKCGATLSRGSAKKGEEKTEVTEEINEAVYEY